MIKSEMFEIIRNEFKDYGFNVQGNRFYLDLDDVFIVVGINKDLESYLLEYNFAIKAIHEKSERKNNMFDGYDLFGLATFFSKQNKLYLDEFPERTFREEIRDMIHRYIDPFKENAFEYIKNVKFKPGKTNNTEEFVIMKKAKDFLGIKY